MNINEESLQNVLTMSGVTGGCLADGMGEVLETTLEDESVSELIAFIAGMTPALAEALGVDEIDQVLLSGQDDDHLSVFLQEENILGVSSERKTSILAMSEKLQSTLSGA
jgi:predicted regulator of Ras-like GTPase activity (Roadblock/LC7/MglB family)